MFRLQPCDGHPVASGDVESHWASSESTDSFELTYSSPKRTPIRGDVAALFLA